MLLGSKSAIASRKLIMQKKTKKNKIKIEKKNKPKKMYKIKRIKELE